jgi:hypothetical protein
MAQESIREHGDMDPAVLHKIDDLLAIGERMAALRRLPGTTVSTAMDLTKISLALYRVMMRQAREIAESL